MAGGRLPGFYFRKRVKESASESASAERLTVTSLALGLIYQSHHGGAFAPEHALGGLGKAAAFDGRTAGTGNRHDFLQKNFVF
jgi:hypothetical protein